MSASTINKIFLFFIYLCIELCSGLIFNPSLVYAQEDYPIDSLKSALNKTKTDSTQVKILYQIGNYFLKKNRQEGLYYLEQADQLARNAAYDEGRLKILMELGQYFEKKEDYDNANQKLKLARVLAEQKKDYKKVAHFSYRIANNYLKAEDAESAIYFFYKASQVYKQIDDKKNQFRSIEPIADLFYSLGKYQQALNYFSEMVHLAREIKDSTALALALNHLGSTFIKQEKYQRAQEFLDEAFKIAEIKADSYLQALIYISYGEVYTKLQKFPQAKDSALKALSIGHQMNDSQLISDAYHNLAGISNELNVFADALDYQKLALEYLKKTKNLRKIQYYYLAISEIYAKIPDFQNAYLYHQLYSNLQDSLYNQKTLEAMYQMDSKYQSERREAEINELKSQRTINEEKLLQRKIINYSLGLGLILILTFTFFLLRSNQRILKTNDLLKDRNRQIERQTQKISSQKSSLEEINRELANKNEKLIALDQEKNYLMGVVAHDLRSPINQVRGVLEIIKLTSGETNEEQHQHIHIAINSLVRLDRMINRILDVNAMEQAEESLQLNRVDVADILEAIIKTSKQSASEKNITLITDIPSEKYYAQLDENYAAQIFENLISNAVKFSPLHKKIYIQLTNQQDTVKVIIQDEGPGFAKEDLKHIFGKFQKLSAKPTAGEPSTGLGLSIVKKYVDLMEGQLHLESKPGKGAKFTVEFKKA
ncbi:MAG: tetratricopeptide repeat-containing sensor histidine kinase [Microscillaceae bacterium]|nr:tetratricopeptide repeat-containing sensor histidine kinase [Microscillaceae bacterium]